MLHPGKHVARQSRKSLKDFCVPNDPTAMKTGRNENDPRAPQLGTMEVRRKLCVDWERKTSRDQKKKWDCDSSLFTSVTRQGVWGVPVKRM